MFFKNIVSRWLKIRTHLQADPEQAPVRHLVLFSLEKTGSRRRRDWRRERRQKPREQERRSRDDGRLLRRRRHPRVLRSFSLRRRITLRKKLSTQARAKIIECFCQTAYLPTY